eukprot:CAMPEP_0201521504 /NCGR_PEP_ID=MMETSP0161_2-20130828/14468_1 /ASSEMBLY_ACC=CAM_ASM_000251 /TAXON_ID=180227 /ORGANISM="Neoparamoeba aestuarina, Strain SoJaBio B1-5/56/2" /LENGTH=70 /DNA_ID=CAMNT_0047920149 /DNA_START=12 /DNA_END=221 /DNA_ORIENTATION=+
MKAQLSSSSSLLHWNCESHDASDFSRRDQPEQKSAVGVNEPDDAPRNAPNAHAGKKLLLGRDGLSSSASF